jgi:hypothetical protein
MGGPAAYQGEVWAEQIPASTATGCSYGLVIEANYTNRVPSKELFNFHSFETDGVHIQASNYDPDYNGPVGEDYWDITYLQKFKSVQNLGAQVRELEEYSKMYILRDYSLMLQFAKQKVTSCTLMQTRSTISTALYTRFATV